MKLYLSSIRIPSRIELEKLVGKPLNQTSVALIPNAKDYYVKRPRDFTVNDLVQYMQNIGLKVDIVDLRDFDESDSLKSSLINHDIIWAMGGNTFMLRYEMKRSGFDDIIKELLNNGMVYGGDSAGALVAGISIAGIEEADEPKFAEQQVSEGLGLVHYVILPHVDNPEFTAVLPIFRKLHQDKEIIELRDDQAVVFSDDKYHIVEADKI